MKLKEWINKRRIPRLIYQNGMWFISKNHILLPFHAQKGGFLKHNTSRMIPYLLVIIILILSLINGVGATNYYDEWTDDIPISLVETVVDERGNPCSACTVNITILNPNSTVTNISTLMQELSAGKYNLTLQHLEIGQYPVTIFANKSGFNGTSDLTLLKVYDVFPTDTWWDIAGLIVFIFLSVISAMIFTRSSNMPLRLFSFIITILFLIIQNTFVRSLTINSGFTIDSELIRGIDTMYQLLMWIFRICIFWIGVTIMVESIKSLKAPDIEGSAT